MMSSMTYQDVDLAEVTDLSAEDVEAREVYEENTADTVNNPLLNFLRDGGDLSGLSVGGRQRSAEDPVVVEGSLYGQNFEEIRAGCLEAGELWTDPEFPPDDGSLFFSERQYGLEWLRPHQLVEEPRLMEGGGDRFDINQGELGDCWLLAAMANLVMDKRVRARVVPLDQSFSVDYAGVFHFKFWQYGEWVDVVVDDLLPTRNGSLVYMHSDSKSEFWSALFEKAYAKLNGSYENLVGGLACEAMVDFTGGCAEIFNLTEPPRDLFQIMLSAHQRSSLMGCSIEEKENRPDPSPDVTEEGLVRAHAYSITKVKHL